MKKRHLTAIHGGLSSESKASKAFEILKKHTASKYYCSFKEKANDNELDIILPDGTKYYCEVEINKQSELTILRIKTDLCIIPWSNPSLVLNRVLKSSNKLLGVTVATRGNVLTLVSGASLDMQRVNSTNSNISYLFDSLVEQKKWMIDQIKK